MEFRYEIGSLSKGKNVIDGVIKFGARGSIHCDQHRPSHTILFPSCSSTYQ